MAEACGPTWSIVVPTYQRPEQVTRCLRAVLGLGAERRDLEVIVVDDGSDPPLAESLEGPLPSWVRIERLPNGGPGPARNHGARSASGRWLAFTDDDCLPRGGWLDGLEAALERAPGALVGGRVVNGLPDDVYASASQVLVDFLYRWFNVDPDDARVFTSNNMACDRRRFLDMGGFSEELPLPAAEDREFCDRWRAPGNRLVYEPTAVVDHHHRMRWTGFLRQHFTYGRAAPTYHRLRRRTTGERRGWLPEPLAFYRSLVLQPLRSGAWNLLRSWALSGWLVISQVAYLAGAVRGLADLRRHRAR